MLNIIKTYTSSSRIGHPAIRKPEPGSQNPAPSVSDDMKRLVSLFWAWKLLLLAIALASPGVGYDTSTGLLLAGKSDSSALSWRSRVLQRLVLKLTRWDAVYFATSSAHGHLTEQEWAFSKAHAVFTSKLANMFFESSHPSLLVCHALTGIVVSHLAHLGAVLVLYKLTREIIPSSQQQRAKIAFTAASLHIISPAGVFLSASYGEASYALASFAGSLCYVLALKERDRTRQAAGMALSGFCFGCSALARSNGIFNGIIFAIDAVTTLYRLWTRFRMDDLITLLGLIVGGSFTGLGFVAPQILAYVEYCTGGYTRPWCAHMPPSIYSWVQHHYWNVGFLNYWTSSNIPLFLLAAPMLVLLLVTGHSALLHAPAMIHGLNEQRKDDDASLVESVKDAAIFTGGMQRFALPQLLLAVLAFTSFHVQIVNRISSGYTVWYIVLAITIEEVSQRGKDTGIRPANRYKEKMGKWIVRAMVGYAIIQAGLFASFLPPA